MSKSLWTGLGVLAMALVARAAAPGPIDGQNIPLDYTDNAEIAVQTNNTGYGDQVINSGAYTGGSEVDELFLATDGSYLRIGISGNLERNGHAFIIFIDSDDPFLTGQTELRAEGVGGPPETLQTASREIVINTNGPGDPSDDTWSYGADGTILPCEADFAIAVDVASSRMSISSYYLQNPLLGAVDTYDPTPDNPNDGLVSRYASREFVGQTVTDDNNDVLENLQAPTWGPAGFNDTNTTGVTGSDASSPESAITGMELSVPLDLFQGASNLNIFVALVDGSGTTGAFVPQTLPAVTDDDVCTSGVGFPLRSDISPVTECRSVNLASLPTFTGVSEGLISPAEYGGTVVESQSCPTPYGDQDFDPNAAVISGGSELDALFVDNDEDYLYIGITGNLEGNWNRFMLMIDSDPDGADLGSNGREIVGGSFAGINTPNAQQGVGNFQGDALPEDINSNAVNFNYIWSTTFNNSPMYVHQYDLEGKFSTYIGSTMVNTNGGTLSNGIVLAYNTSNEVGVNGDCFNEESCRAATTNGMGTPAAVAAKARTAVTGFEWAIPWSAINVDPQNLPDRVHVFAMVTGEGGAASNQALPPLRPRSNNAFDQHGNPIKLMVENPGDGPNDYSDGKGQPHRQFDGYAAVYFITVPGDYDGDGDIDLADHANFVKCLFGPDETPNPTLPVTAPACLDAFDFDSDGDVDLQDFGGLQMAFTGA